MDGIGASGNFSHRPHRSVQHDGIASSDAQVAKIIREFFYRIHTNAPGHPPRGRLGTAAFCSSIRGPREQYETLSAHCIIGHSVLRDHCTCSHFSKKRNAQRRRNGRYACWFSQDDASIVSHYNAKLGRCYAEFARTKFENGNLVLFREVVDGVKGKIVAQITWSHATTNGTGATSRLCMSTCHQVKE